MGSYSILSVTPLSLPASAVVQVSSSLASSSISLKSVLGEHDAGLIRIVDDRAVNLGVVRVAWVDPRVPETAFSTLHVTVHFNADSPGVVIGGREDDMVRVAVVLLDIPIKVFAPIFGVTSAVKPTGLSTTGTRPGGPTDIVTV